MPASRGLAPLADVADCGFRNPWRMSLDVVTGELYVGEVSCAGIGLPAWPRRDWHWWPGDSGTDIGGVFTRSVDQAGARPTTKIRAAAIATSPDLGRCARSHKPSPSDRRVRRTLHTETGGPKPAETRLGHVHGVPENDGPAPDTRGRSRETGYRARAAVPSTSGSRRLRRRPLPVRSKPQPPRCSSRSRAVISSHDSADSGQEARLARRRSTSASCQGWTGTSSGRLETSSQRSSTSWSFSAAVRPKTEPVSGVMGTVPQRLSSRIKHRPV